MPVETEPKKYRYSYRLKGGSHHVRNEGLTIEAGDIFHTDENMIKLHGKDRWELIKEDGESIDDLRNRIKQLEAKLGTPQVETPAPEPVVEEDPYEDLDNKSISELRSIAKALEVSLDSCNGKKEIVSVIRQHLDTA